MSQQIEGPMHTLPDLTRMYAGMFYAALNDERLETIFETPNQRTIAINKDEKLVWIEDRLTWFINFVYKKTWLASGAGPEITRLQRVSCIYALDTNRDHVSRSGLDITSPLYQYAPSSGELISIKSAQPFRGIERVIGIELSSLPPARGDRRDPGESVIRTIAAEPDGLEQDKSVVYPILQNNSGKYAISIEIPPNVGHRQFDYTADRGGKFHRSELTPQTIEDEVQTVLWRLPFQPSNYTDLR